MALNIGFFQYELSHPHNAPHVGMSLLLDDLRKAGHKVDAALVQVGQVDSMIEQVRGAGYDFIALDSVFTVPVVERIKEGCPDTPVLVGGVNALPLILFGPADYAIVGPGREGMIAFADAVEAGSLPGDVPNLWFRSDLGEIDVTTESRGWSLAPELDRYDPDLDWDYIGEGRAPGSNTRFASIVPEFGCAFGSDALDGPAYSDLAREETSSAVESLPLSDAARRRAQPFFENTRGCAFCAFRFQDYVIDKAEESADRAVRQMTTLFERYGVRDISIQSENPFRFLKPLAERIRDDRLDVRSLLVRTFPALLAKNPSLVEESIAAVTGAGIRLHLQQLGFENFVQEELHHLGKGISSHDNIAAARLLFDWKQKFGNSVELFGGHGFILFTPWTTPEDVRENIDIVRREAPFLAGAIGLASRLCFYDPFSPIYRLAEREGLAVRSPLDYGLAFRFADERTEMLCRLTRALEGEMARAGSPVGPMLSRAVLTATVPLFAGADAPATREPPGSLYRMAEKAARENLGRDGELWQRGRPK